MMEERRRKSVVPRLPGFNQPIYEQGSNYISLVFRYGGQFIHVPKASYMGGEVIIYDYANPDDVSLLSLDELCEAKGLVGFKRYYNMVPGGFVLLQTDKAVREFCAKSIFCDAALFFVDIDNSLVDTQLSLSDACENIGVGGENDDQCEDFDSCETDADFGDEEMDENNDDMLFDDNVDLSKALTMLNEEGMNEIGCSNIRDIDLDIGSDDLAATDDELESINGSDEEYPKEYRFDPKTMEDPELFCGLAFKDFKEFKEAVRNYSIKRGRPIRFTKSDKVRCRAKCKKTGCPWSIYARIMEGGKAEIRVFESKHSCALSLRNSNVKSGWIADKYMSDFSIEPNPNMWNFRKKVMRDIKCHVSKSQAYRARTKALEKIRGSQDYQYNLLQSYIEEVKRNDKEATMVLQTTSAEIIEDGDSIGSEHQFTQRFFRLYCCLSALKKGMLVGCRKIFGIDGCHLRGEHGGMLLAAVGIDPNNNLFPIAYAATEGENKDSWTWFLDLLKKDLNIERDFEWTIISDKQKGLIPACDSVFPAAHHRFCIRHLHANMVLAGFTGGNMKSAFYQAATATTITSFTQAMNLIKCISSNAFKWLDGKPPQHWSRSHFNTALKCDMLLNNLCESFNGRIRAAREMPIISMFENIRNFLMVRFQQNRDMSKNNWGGMKLCPRIKKRLDKNIERAAECIPYKSDEFIYECHESDGMQYDVNLKDMVCSCRKWGLTGIPCPHACAALSFCMADHEEYVDECYKVDTYKMVYELAIQPVCGIKQLSPTSNQQILPPVYKKQPGRPKKLRKKSQGEAESSKIKKGKGVKKLSRAGVKCRCSNCGKNGHNIRKCPDRMKNASEEDSEQPICTPFQNQGSISINGVIQEDTTSTHGKQREENEVVEWVLQGKHKQSVSGVARKNKRETPCMEMPPELREGGNMNATAPSKGVSNPNEGMSSFTSLLKGLEHGPRNVAPFENLNLPPNED